jgi:nucleoside-diphosphate-sugar epimerase
MFELFLWASRGLTLEIAGGDRTISPSFVKDVAAAILACMEKETANGGIYFIADNRPWAWSGFREALLQTGGVRARNLIIPYGAAYLIGLVSEFGSLFTGRPALLNRQKVREAVQRSWLCDTSTTEKELGFTPAYSLQQGLQITWQWYRENNWLR